MNTFNKQEGFAGEKIIVLPSNFLKEVSQHPLVSSVYLTGIGYFPDAQYHYIQRQMGSEQHILIYCINGEGFYKINGTESILKKDNLLVIPKGVPHSYGSNEKSPWSILWFHFLGQNAESYFYKENSDFRTASVSLEKLSKIKSLFEDIYHCLEKGYTIDHMVYVSQAMAHLLGALFFLNQDDKMGLKENNICIDESILFMVNHLENTLTLKELANQANLSATHYSYLFKDKTGVSPIDYFIRLKIQRACQYLDMTNLMVNEIAKTLGFRDPYYFSRLFKKITQLSPQEYRNVKKG